MSIRVLAVTTSTHRGGVAVVEEGRVLGEATYADLKGHAEQLFAALGRALAGDDADAAAVRSARAQVTALACDLGPGSFTGVRVGAASLKGIALAAGLPLVGVGSLEVMARAAFRLGLVPQGEVVLATLDAKKGEIFAAAYDDQGAEVLAPRHLPRGEAGARIAEVGAPCRVVGEVAADLADLAPRLLRHPSTDLPDAAEVGRFGAERIAASAPAALDPAALEPCYVRAPDAKPMAREL